MATEPATNGRERRLHPLSWLFVLLQQLRQFALPLLILLLTGRGDRGQFLPLFGVGVLAVVSVAQYFTYRYRIGAEGLAIRSGLFQRTVRHIPYARLHDVSLQQSLLHRWFGVAEVRLESAGGVTPEANMRVLSLADAQALERLVRSHAAATPGAASTLADEPPLLALDAGELLRLGLVSNRGMLVVAAAFGLVAQTDSRLFGEAARDVGRALLGWTEQWHLAGAGLAIGALALLGVAVVLLRLFSVAIAFLQYQGFALRAHGGRLHVVRGLLTRWRGSVPLDRLQALHVEEGVLHRLFDRRSLRVDTMASAVAGEERGVRALAPIAPPARVDALVRRLLPGVEWPPSTWQPLHARAWWRRFVPAAFLWLLASAVLIARFGAWGALALAGVPWAAFAARRWAAHAGYALGEGIIAVRTGWLDRRWQVAAFDKLQGLRLARTPLDRRFGMASLLLDTAGAQAAALRVRYLPEAEAQALYAQLARAMTAAPTRARTAATTTPAP
jgi:putative membrane protein